MININYTQTWWEKDHLTINPFLFKALLENDGTVSFHDTATNKTIRFSARDIRDCKELEYDQEYNEYIFPIKGGEIL